MFVTKRYGLGHDMSRVQINVRHRPLAMSSGFYQKPMGKRGGKIIIRARATVLMRMSAASRFSGLPRFLTAAASAGAGGKIELYCPTSHQQGWEGHHLGRPMVQQPKPLVSSVAHWG